MNRINVPTKIYTNNIKNFQSNTKLCNSQGEINVRRMDGPLTDNSILWAIPADEPKTVYYYPMSQGLQYFPCKKEERVRKNQSLRTANMIHHNYLVQGRPVLCAGESHKRLSSDNRSLTNKSGHYTPDNDCLDYVKQIFEENGNPITNVVYMKQIHTKKARKARKARKTRKSRNRMD